MSLVHNSGEYIVAVGRAAPPLAVSGVVMAGLALQDWVLIATLIYTLLQTLLVIHKFFKERRKADDDGG